MLCNINAYCKLLFILNFFFSIIYSKIYYIIFKLRSFHFIFPFVVSEFKLAKELLKLNIPVHINYYNLLSNKLKTLNSYISSLFLKRQFDSALLVSSVYNFNDHYIHIYQVFMGLGTMLLLLLLTLIYFYYELLFILTIIIFIINSK